MSNRVRYVSQGDGSLRSFQTFIHPTNGGRFVVTINPSSLSFTIRDVVAEMDVITGNVERDTTNSSNLKREAKNALMSLGIEFSSESRVRTTTSNVEDEVNNDYIQEHQN